MDRVRIEHFVRKNWIGLLILAVGFVSFAVVGVKAVGKLADGGNNQSQEQEQAQVLQQEINNFKSNAPRATTSITPPAKPKYKRDISIKESEIRGAWQADLKGSKILLQLSNQKYKMVIVPSSESGSASNTMRLYSNGTYTLENDILMFKPDISIPAPASKVTSYAFLTRSSFPVMVAVRRGGLIFQRPVAAANVYVPHNHPLLNKSDNDLVVFDVLK